MISNPESFAKTKILATLGPATEDVETIQALMAAGVDGVKPENSSKPKSEQLFNSIHSACQKENTSLAVLVDVQGPKIRIGELEQPNIEIKTGNLIEITTDDLLGNEKIISTSYKSLVDDAKIDDQILINDGLIRLTIVEKKKSSIFASSTRDL